MKTLKAIKNGTESHFGMFLVDADGAREQYGFGSSRSRFR